MMPASTVAFCNLKGGVGKTSTTFHLAGTLARGGRRVLLLDVHPQASLTQGFFGPDAMRALPREATIAALFGDGLVPDPAELIRPTGFAASLDRPRVRPPDPAQRARALALRSRPATPPSATSRPRSGATSTSSSTTALPTSTCAAWAALTAADHLVVPLQAEDFGSQGIAAILECVDAVQAGPNPGLHLAGYLLTMFNPRLAIHRAYEAMLRRLHGGSVLTTTIPIGADFKEAVAVRKPIVEHKPKGASAKSIRTLADELLDRVSCTVQNDAPDDSRRVA